MKLFPTIDPENRGLLRTGIVASTAAALTLGACSTSTSSPDIANTVSVSPSVDNQTTPDATTSSSVSSSESRGTQITFDALGGGSSTILVYRGAGTTAADRETSGHYEDGAMAPGLCKTIGRTITSDTSVGETARSSDKWIKLATASNVGQFATAVYIKNPDETLKTLPAR